jgi:hypothetical protein
MRAGIDNTGRIGRLALRAWNGNEVGHACRTPGLANVVIARGA